jgi:integrase
MPRERSGSFFKREKKLPNGKREITWWARVTYTDPVTGKRSDRQRRAENRAHAKELMQELVSEYDATGGRALEHARKTFVELAVHYEGRYLKPAEYVDGRKVGGLRSLPTVEGQLKVLKSHFGLRPLRSITHGDLRDFRAARLKAPTRGDLARHERALTKDPKVEICVTRSIASVNRELALLRRMMNVAQREGWIMRSPFSVGESLISLADERKRERILTRDEEARLLEACGPREMVYTRRGKKVTAQDSGARREHLRAIIICALDTGMRQGEMLKLRWHDVDLENRIITVQAFNTKTMRQRQVSMTTRLTFELERLYNQSPKQPEGLVFGIRDNVKHGFESVRHAAGLDDLRFHDLRHTAATRLVGAHISLSEVGRVLGHTQANTTYRYVNANVETARRASAALDAFHSAEAVKGEGEAVQAPEMVN